MALYCIAHITVLNDNAKILFIWDIKFYQKIKIQTGKLLIPTKRKNMQQFYIFSVKGTITPPVLGSGSFTDPMHCCVRYRSGNVPATENI